MKLQKIFIEVSVADELPGVNELDVYSNFKNGKTFYVCPRQEINEAPASYSTWLKPIPAAYVFTREELEAFWDKAFEAGAEHEWNKHFGPIPNPSDSKTLFNQLVK